MTKYLIVLFGVLLVVPAFGADVFLKAGMNGSRTEYVSGGTHYLYRNSDNAQLGWNVSGCIEMNIFSSFQGEVGLGLKRSSSSLIAWRWTEDIIDQTLNITYLNIPVGLRFIMAKYLPDILVGFSTNFPLYANYHHSYRYYKTNQYEKSVGRNFWDMQTAVTLGIGKKFTIHNRTFLLDCQYLYHLNDIEYEQMGKFHNKEMQILFGVLL